MIQRIYAWPLSAAILIVLITLAGWSYFNLMIRQVVKVISNFCLFCATAIVILYATILTRTPGDYDVVLRPFAALMEAKDQPELYREMLMNVFLFFPLGLTLSNALPRRCCLLYTSDAADE